MPSRPWLVVGLCLAGAVPAAGQLIPIRTVPVFQSHQFDLFPSLTMAMGRVSLAIADSLLDPFNNPAKGTRIRGARVFTSPGVYRVEQGGGGGRTLPLGAVARSGDWFGGLALAVQGIEQRPADGRRGNSYVFGMLGKSFPKSGVSLGGSLSWAGLTGLQGVDQLFAGNSGITQDGSALDLRFSALKGWADGRSLTALVVHNRFGVTQDVTYFDQIWDPGAQAFSRRSRVEANVERSRTWGLHAEYVVPLKAPGWRVGWMATTNLKSHPKIPTYQIPLIVEAIFRDPGNSEAFNLGVGVAKTSGGTTFGADVIYEPVWSHTWADSDLPVQTVDGATIAPGGKTIENWFTFSNAVVRVGFAHEFPMDPSQATVFRLGLAAHSINYSLAQKDHVQLTARGLEEGWIEWTPTWGVSFRFPGFDLHYRGSRTGTDLLRFSGDDVTVTEPGLGGNILAPTFGTINMRGLRVTSHQFSISVPIR